MIKTADDVSLTSNMAGKWVGRWKTPPLRPDGEVNKTMKVSPTRDENGS
jgi:hypothetical protein